MQPWRPVALAVLALLAGCTTPIADDFGGPGTGLGLPVMASTVVDPQKEGFEPSLHITRDGAIFLCSPRGVTAGTDLWRSRDGGASFHYVGFIVEASQNAFRSYTADNAGGDCDLGEDAGGRLYLVDSWAASVSVAWSDDGGDTWSGVPFSHVPHIVDRPWVLGGRSNEVFITSGFIQTVQDRDEADIPGIGRGGGLWVIRSTDGGMTFPQQVLVVQNDHRIGHNSNIATDGDNVYVLYGWKSTESELETRLGKSADRGNTWTHHTAARVAIDPDQCFSPFNIFPVVSVHAIAGVAVSWVVQDAAVGRMDLHVLASPDGGETWRPPVLLADRPGTRAYPWIAMDSKGTVHVAWYETNVTSILVNTEEQPYPVPDRCEESGNFDSAAWHLHYARIENATSPNPTIREGLVQEAPIHRGYLGRPYAEVLQIELLADGRAAVAYVADVPEGKARPMFAVEKGFQEPNKRPVDSVNARSELRNLRLGIGSNDIT